MAQCDEGNTRGANIMPRNPTKRPDRLAEIEAQKKEIARLKAALADTDEDDPDDVACSPAEFLRTVAKLLKRVACAEAERDDLRRRLDGLVKAVELVEHGRVCECDNDVGFQCRGCFLSNALAIARGEKEE